MSVTKEQQVALLRAIDPQRVGKDGKGFSHVEAWDIRRTMNAIFGFAEWSADVLQMELIYESPDEKNGKTRHSVGYRAQCRLSVGGSTYTEWAAGDAINPTRGDAHDQAMKTAESQAFKRCAVNLGDQFGLSLYKDGSVQATVQEVVGTPHADDGRVAAWLQLLDGVTLEGELAVLAQEFRGADMSASLRSDLVNAYKLAQRRVSEG
jgi:recombination DNA repair RAD52 pathway protein